MPSPPARDCHRALPAARMAEPSPTAAAAPQVRFLHDDHRATLVATRPISADEEVFISYIDDNARVGVAKRRAALREYGFTCDCPKCTSEEAWQRRLRPRR